MAKYKIQFNDYQLGCFSLFSGTDEVKIKLQSVLAYIIKYPELNTNDLYKKYQYKTNKTDRYTRRCFNNYLSKLEELNLISRVKNGLRTYINLIDVPKDVPVDVPELKVAQSIENTSLEAVDEVHNSKDLISNNNINNIVLNTSVSEEEIKESIKATMTELNLKSKYIFNFVYNNMMNVVVNRKGMFALILKNIEIAKTYLEIKRTLYMNNVAAKKNKIINTVKANSNNYRNKGSEAFCNFTGREYSAEQYASIEEQLLGWA